MFEIKGKVNKAICFGKVVEEEAIRQIERMCNYELSKDAKIAIMPDVHAGKGCTIGTTMTIVDKVCPNIVGVDIGCGMFTVKLEKQAIDFKAFDAVCHYIPSGQNCWERALEKFNLKELRCFKHLKDLKWLECSLGTLGGGNHFIEIDKDSNGDYYLIIHSGSRNLGKQVADYYQKVAIELHSGKKEFLEKKKRIIDFYKEEGKSEKIQAALKLLGEDYKNYQAKIPSDLCWLYGKELLDYLHDVKICQNFALRNRELMANVILEKVGLKALESFHTIHNYIDMEDMVLRKGAIRAHKDEIVLIPINMKDGSVLAKGKGNEKWNYSAPHGAGRIMSRSEAKERISLEEYQEAMKGIYTTSVNEKTIDEAPFAYKSLDDIIEVIEDSVEIIDIMKPVYNYKASE